MTKTAAAKETLEDINPDVIFEEYTYDITTTSNFEHFLGRIQHGSIDGHTQVDLVCMYVGLGWMDRWVDR